MASVQTVFKNGQANALKITPAGNRKTEIAMLAIRKSWGFNWATPASIAEWF
jgi:hypothetical protein